MKYHIIGLMSGTSLDGVDIAYCVFEKIDNKWQYTIVEAETIPYTNKWLKRLKELENSDGLTFNITHIEYGRLLGLLVKKFIRKHRLKVDYIASHGHTIFHQPEKRMTVQIGSGASIAANSGVSTTCDFRSLDVALGGHGAPLVPIGDELLFGKYDACLNIGGISNISYRQRASRIAYDISPANMILNYMAQMKGYSYDVGGHLAQSGKVDKELYATLNNIAYYRKPYPKSLGKEWVFGEFLSCIQEYKLSVEDYLRTFVEHIAFQIATVVLKEKLHKILITGGGAKNKFLIERIQFFAKESQLIIPEDKLVEYKEALIFAFLGLLRLQQTPNCLKSVTGANQDNCGGAIYCT
ncbi:MAG: anhydro-N-acetylmuramic acid kinase [Bacteroidales bacterium]|jgi:anhydro-N-acetylmuramic acid kinase